MGCKDEKAYIYIYKYIYVCITYIRICMYVYLDRGEKGEGRLGQVGRPRPEGH